MENVSCDPCQGFLNGIQKETILVDTMFLYEQPFSSDIKQTLSFVVTFCDLPPSWTRQKLLGAGYDLTGSVPTLNKYPKNYMACVLVCFITNIFFSYL